MSLSLSLSLSSSLSSSSSSSSDDKYLSNLDHRDCFDLIEDSVSEGLISPTEAGRWFKHLIDTHPAYYEFINTPDKRELENYHLINKCIDAYDAYESDQKQGL